MDETHAVLQNQVLWLEYSFATKYYCIRSKLTVF